MRWSIRIGVGIRKIRISQDQDHCYHIKQAEEQKNEGNHGQEKWKEQEETKNNEGSKEGSNSGVWCYALCFHHPFLHAGISSLSPSPSNQATLQRQSKRTMSNVISQSLTFG